MSETPKRRRGDRRDAMLLRETDALALPGVSEPYLAWTFSGEVEFQEREGDGPWLTHRIKAGSFFLTTGGGPYECRWSASARWPYGWRSAR